MNKLIAYAKAHKVLSSILALGVIFLVYFLFFRSTASPSQYVLTQASTGTIITSVSGTGQVSGSSEVPVSPKVSGTITYVNTALEGKSVKAGTVIATIDSIDAQKALRDAQLNLQKLQVSQVSDQPKLQDTINNDQDNVTKAYQDVFNNVSAAFLDLPTLINDTYNVLFSNSLNGTCRPNLCDYPNLVDVNTVSSVSTLVDQAKTDFVNASASYTPNFNDYNAITYTASDADLTDILSKTIHTTQLISQNIKSEQTVLNTVVQNIQTQSHASVPSAITTEQNTLATDLAKANSDLSTLLNIQGTVLNDQQTLVADERNLSSTQATDPIDLTAQQNAVSDAELTLSYYTVRAPLDGIVANITAERGANASSGTALATMVSPQQIAETTLNEVDVSKIALGQQVTLTFDAIPNLTLTGKVIYIDTLGTVTQGVVSYSVKIAFDAIDSQVKPGMSVSAAIITQAKQDVLEVPISAIKTQGGQSYVQVVKLPASLNGQTTVSATSVPAPQNQLVTVGIESDTMAEITSGLNVGDTLIVRTISSSTSSSASSASRTGTTGTFPGLGGGAGAGGAAGAGVRVLGR